MNIAGIGIGQAVHPCLMWSNPVSLVQIPLGSRFGRRLDRMPQDLLKFGIHLFDNDFGHLGFAKTRTTNQE